MPSPVVTPTLFEYGGSAASIPWFATLFVHPIGGGPPDLCGGVVVGPTTVLTAGHCVAGAETITAYPSSEGNGWWPEPGGYTARKLAPSPEYNESYTGAATYDVGVLTVVKPFGQGTTVARVDLDGAAWASLPDGAMLMSAGHGLSCVGGNECVTSSLMVVQLPKIADQRCAGPANDQWDPSVVGDSYCAGFDVAFEAQPCQGDSGGPLFDATTVYGVVSRGDASLGCGASQRPTLFAGVAVNAEFLKSKGIMGDTPPAVDSTQFKPTPEAVVQQPISVQGANETAASSPPSTPSPSPPSPPPPTSPLVQTRGSSQHPPPRMISSGCRPGRRRSWVAAALVLFAARVYENFSL